MLRLRISGWGLAVLCFISFAQSAGAAAQRSADWRAKRQTLTMWLSRIQTQGSTHELLWMERYLAVATAFAPQPDHFISALRGTDLGHAASALLHLQSTLGSHLMLRKSFAEQIRNQSLASFNLILGDNPQQLIHDVVVTPGKVWVDGGTSDVVIRHFILEKQLLPPDRLIVVEPFPKPGARQQFSLLGIPLIEKPMAEVTAEEVDHVAKGAQIGLVTDRAAATRYRPEQMAKTLNAITSWNASAARFITDVDFDKMPDGTRVRRVAIVDANGYEVAIADYFGAVPGVESVKLTCEPGGRFFDMFELLLGDGAVAAPPLDPILLTPAYQTTEGTEPPQALLRLRALAR